MESTKKAYIIAVRFNPEEYEFLKSKSEEQTLAISTYIRRLIFYEMREKGFLTIGTTDKNGGQNDTNIIDK